MNKLVSRPGFEPWSLHQQSSALRYQCARRVNRPGEQSLVDYIIQTAAGIVLILCRTLQIFILKQALRV